MDNRCHIPLEFVIENLWDPETGEEAHDIALLTKILTNIVQYVQPRRDGPSSLPSFRLLPRRISTLLFCTRLPPFSHCLLSLQIGRSTFR